jgi:hypothetical protein
MVGRCLAMPMPEPMPEPEPEPQPHANSGGAAEQDGPDDAFERLGLGPDLYDYREPYRRYLQRSSSSSSSSSPTATAPAAGALAPAQPPQEQAQARQALYQAAAKAIASADFLLIGAGAGMGVDSGLAAYADVAGVDAWASRGHDYNSLCRPALLDEDPALFYGFWGHCYNRYREAAPHAGYDVLRRWCTGVLPAPRGGAASNHWVYTSNVDGHFRKAGFEDSCLLELHGGCTGPTGWFCRSCAAKQNAKADAALAAAAAESEASKDAGGEGEGVQGLPGCTAPAEDDFQFAIDPQSMTVHDPEESGRTDGGEEGEEEGEEEEEEEEAEEEEEEEEEGRFGGGFGGGWPRCAASGCGGLLRCAPYIHVPLCIASF